MTTDENHSSHPQTRISAGFAATDFTPEPGLELLGQMHQRIAVRARDPLMASACALQSADEVVVLVSVDICILPDQFVRSLQEEFARRTGISPGRLLLHATHTHVAPTVMDLLAARADPAFAQSVRNAILASAARALDSLEPVSLFSAEESLAEMGWNRRAMFEDGSSRMYGHSGQPGFIGMEGSRDPGLCFIWAAIGDKIKGILVNFSTHPNAIEGEKVYSADIPGAVRQSLQRWFDPETIVVYLTGAAGNTAPSMLDPYVPSQPWRGEEGLIRSGQYLAAGAAKVMASGFAPMSNPVLRLVQSTLQLPLRPWPSAGDPIFPEPLVSDTWPQARAYYEHAREDWPRRMQEESPRPVRLSVLRLGDAVICTNPAELFVEFGSDIKAASPARVTLVSQLTDGYAGYVPTRRAFSRGGYETWPAPTSLLAPEAGQAIVSETQRLLKSVF